MEQFLKPFLLASLMFFYNLSNSQTVDPPYEVGRWQGFRSCAVSFTFDDWTSNQPAIAIPMFNEFGFKMTLFPVINWSPNWTALQTAANQGHEIASHTMSHANFSSLSIENQNTELQNSQAEINSRIQGQKCITFAYPFCATGKDSVCEKYYIAARTCSGVTEPSTPSNFMRISSYLCGTQSSITTPAHFKARADAAASINGWVVFLLHGIDNDGGYSPVTSGNLRGTLDSLSKYPNKYWVSTFGNVARYIKERNSASVRELSNRDSIYTLSVTDQLPDSIYNYPITIRRPLPQNWAGASITQSDKNIEVKIVEVNSIKYLMFDVVPDGGDVIISRSGITNVMIESSEFPSRPYLMQNFPNPFNPSTTIKYYLNTSTDVTLKMYNLFGQELETLVAGYQSAGEHILNWQPKNYASGMYFYRLQAGRYVETKKLTVIR